MKALIVEDNTIASKLLNIILNKYNCRCDIASSGIKAMLLCFERSYDLIFMDLGLPDISGLSLVKLMRGHDNCNKHTPIIAITAHGENDLKLKCLEAGVDLYLQKPIEQDQIDAAVSMFTV